MEDELIEKERNKTMPTLNDINLEEKINIEQIRQVRATQIWNEPKINESLSLEKLPNDTKNYDKSIKIILLGDSNVGKTSIVNCLNNTSYNNYQRKSLGLEHYNYFIKINNIIIRMQIWDTMGQEKFNSITTNYYKNSDVAIFVYSITDLNSFNKIDQWDENLNDKGNIEDNITNNNDNNVDNVDNNIDNKDGNNNKDLIKVLLGNKKDLENERQVTKEEAETFSQINNLVYFETSAKDGNNIEDMFNYVAEKLLEIHSSKNGDGQNESNNEKLNNNCQDIGNEQKKKKKCC